jgi:hypothetical protein
MSCKNVTVNRLYPNPDEQEINRINHENTKFGKHEIFLFSCFRHFVLS